MNRITNRYIMGKILMKPGALIEWEDGRTLFMAGCFNLYREQDCFLILTTEVNMCYDLINDIYLEVHLWKFEFCDTS